MVRRVSVNYQAPSAVRCVSGSGFRQMPTHMHPAESPGWSHVICGMHFSQFGIQLWILTAIQNQYFSTRDLFKVPRLCTAYCLQNAGLCIVYFFVLYCIIYGTQYCLLRIVCRMQSWLVWHPWAQFLPQHMLSLFFLLAVTVFVVMTEFLLLGPP